MRKININPRWCAFGAILLIMGWCEVTSPSKTQIHTISGTFSSDSGCTMVFDRTHSWRVHYRQHLSYPPARIKISATSAVTNLPTMVCSGTNLGLGVTIGISFTKWPLVANDTFRITTSIPHPPPYPSYLGAEASMIGDTTLMPTWYSWTAYDGLVIITNATVKNGLYSVSGKIEARAHLDGPSLQ